MQYIGLVVCSIMALLSNAAGIGGGGIVTPFLMIFFNLPIKVCVPMTNFFGLIYAIMRLALNFKQQHPNRPERLAIDYEIIHLTMPASQLGTLAGVKLSELMTSDEISILLCITLIYVTIRSLFKAIQIYQQENAAKLVTLRTPKDVQMRLHTSQSSDQESDYS